VARGFYDPCVPWKDLRTTCNRTGRRGIPRRAIRHNLQGGRLKKREAAVVNSEGKISTEEAKVETVNSRKENWGEVRQKRKSSGRNLKTLNN